MFDSFKKYLPFVIGLLGIILVGVGIVIPKLKTEEPEITIIKQEDSASGRNDTLIKVDIEGAVEKPGVYELPKDSRIVDALIPAGGLNANADRNAISKVINMAQKLSDGTKIYFPSNNESITNAGTNVNELVDINNCSLSELDALPGIGAITAQKIVAGRPYQNVSDLLSKKILGSSVFNQVKDRLSVY